jgi:hypothetical protein
LPALNRLSSNLIVKVQKIDRLLSDLVNLDQHSAKTRAMDGMVRHIEFLDSHISVIFAGFSMRTFVRHFG